MNALFPSLLDSFQAYLALEWPLVFKRAGRLLCVQKNIDGELIHIPVSNETLSHVHTLLKKSYDKPLEFRTAIPWDMRPDLSKPAKALSQLWTYGTPFHELLTEEQRIELSWLEIARDVSWLIQLKEQISPLFMGYLNKYGRALRPEVKEYLLVQAKEEIVHALVLKRYLTMANMPTFRRFPALARVSALLPEMHPCIVIAINLVLTWVIDASTVYATQTTGVDVITREVFKVHHADKVRHLDFARRLVEDHFSESSRAHRQRVRLVLNWVIPEMFDSHRFSPEIAAHTCFDFPVNTERQDMVWAIQKSAHNELLDQERFRELHSWLWTMDLV